MAKNKIKLAVFISGRGSNLAAMIEHKELRENCELVLVVSNKRDAPGLIHAQKAGIKTLIYEPQPNQKRTEYDSRLVKLIRPAKPDLIALAGFNRIISTVLLNSYPDRVINVHPADPAVIKGLHGYKRAFDAGMKKTRVTIHLVDEEVDTGPVLDYEEFDISRCRSHSEVEALGLTIEHRLFPAAIASYARTLESEHNKKCVE